MGEFRKRLGLSSEIFDPKHVNDSRRRVDVLIAKRDNKKNQQEKPQTEQAKTPAKS